MHDKRYNYQSKIRQKLDKNINITNGIIYAEMSHWSCKTKKEYQWRETAFDIIVKYLMIRMFIQEPEKTNFM